MDTFIDPPSPFATKEEWQVFLNELLAIPNKTKEILEAIEQAKAMIDTKH